MRNLCFTLFIVLNINTSLAFGAENNMPQLNPEYWTAQVLWLILIFSGLYMMIWKIFLPKIIDSIENRKLKVINDLNQTQKIKNNAEEKLVEYNKIIEDAKKEAKKIVENNRKKLESDIKNKKQKFNEEIEKELITVEKEIQNLKKSSISNINKIAETTTSEIIKRILGTEVNASNVSAIVKDVAGKKIGKYQ